MDPNASLAMGQPSPACLDYAVAQINCTCSTIQPDPARYALDAVMQCHECGQLWRVTSKRSSNRAGGGLLIHGVMVGGLMRSRDVHVWVKQGRNVSREASLVLARAAAEDSYVRDAGELREAVASGQVPEGTGVRRWRAHRDALAHPTVRLFGGAVAVLAVIWSLGLAVLCVLGAATGGWAGVAILAVLWSAIVGKSVRVGVARRRELSSDILRA